MTNQRRTFEKRELEDHPAIAAFIFNAKGELLVMQHLKWGFWTIPVGKVEEGETIDQGLRREMQEELGIFSFDAKVLYDKVGVYSRGRRDVTVQLIGFELTDVKETAQNLEANTHKDLGFRSLEALASETELSDMLMIYFDQIGLRHKGTMTARLV